MSRDRDTFAERLNGLSDRPHIIIRICLEQYDARADAERRYRELERQSEAREELYRKLNGKYAVLAKESARYRECFSGYESRIASMTQINADIRKRYEATAGENDLLKEANTELTKKFVDAVEAGRKTQEKLETAQSEIHGLHTRILALQEQIKLGNRDRFGSGTEKTSAVFTGPETDHDPLDESAADPDTPDAEIAERGMESPADYSAEGVLKKVVRKTTEGRRQ